MTKPIVHIYTYSMLKNKTISIIIPCRNEEAAIHSMLSKIPDYVDEVIVVDNRSTDNTATVAREHGALVLTEKRTHNGIGYGFAHRAGMKKAKGDIIVALDGDDTYPINEIKKVILYMEKSKADFVSCSRFPLSDKHAISPIRQLGVNILNLEVMLLYGYPIKDILSGMWAMNRSALKKLKLESGGWNLSPEIKLAAIAEKDLHFSEYHIHHNVRLNGVSKQEIWKTGFDHLFYILKKRIADGLVAQKQFYLINQSMRLLLKSFGSLFFAKASA